MSWLILIVGLTIAFAGSAAAAALVTTARIDVARAISRRLRGARESLAWVEVTQREVVAATAATSFGVALVGAAMPGIFRHLSVLALAALVVLIGVPITLLGGYVLPRWLTVPRAARAVAELRRPLDAWTAVLQFVLPSHDIDPADDIRALAREGSASGLGGDELVMVGGVMSFADRPVREVMTPRTRIVAVSRSASYLEVEAMFAESGYTRIPVHGESLDEIVGMIHAFDLFKVAPPDPLPIRAVSTVPALRSAADVLLDMQRDRQHLAIVVDEFGGTAGIVTLEDLLEALVGDIADEDDAVPGPVVSADLLEIDGSASASSVAEHFGIALPDHDATSFGGLLARLAGRIPAVGDRFRLSGLEVDVVEASATRAERLLVRRARDHAIDLDGGG